ncbi:hypothetical protein [Spirosoma aerolatum]
MKIDELMIYEVKDGQIVQSNSSIRKYAREYLSRKQFAS